MNEKMSNSCKGKIVSEETKQKLSLINMGRKVSLESIEKTRLANLGKVSPMKGKHHTKEARFKLSIINKGKVSNMKGKHHTLETRKKISEMAIKQFKEKGHPMKGKHLTLEQKIRLKPYQFKKGHIPYSKGIPLTRERKEQISLQHSKDKCTFWQGGKSFEPYSIDWTRTLRRSIRERDNYLCMICLKYGYDVHHIDYNKKNCNPDNLITLCRGCHMKTNLNRSKWIAYFKRKP